MCGIVGYVGDQECASLLMSGLEHLEYRGYDSAGLAVFDGQETHMLRSVGKLRNLAALLAASPLHGKVGLGHTRWATHGAPSEKNAHPHMAGPITVVHNGIVENHLALRAELQARGHVFQSETDTEIFSHFIREKVEAGCSMELAVRQVLQVVEGSYALVVFSTTEPDRLVAAKNASPLVVGIGQDEMLIASDVPAIIRHTRDVVFLHEGELAVVTKNSLKITDLEGNPVERPPKRIDWTPAQAEKGGFKHFMLKEIFEQPRAMADTLRGRLSLERGDVLFNQVQLTDERIRTFDRIVISACGTAWHAGLLGRYWIEQTTRIPVTVDVASEFRYRNPIISDRTLFIAISQSGETADTHAALREARDRGAETLSICNVVDSSIARDSDHVIYTLAGPEIGVASTKAFVTQLIALRLLALRLGRARQTISADEARTALQNLLQLPALVEQLLGCAPNVEKIARKYLNCRDFLFLGRGVYQPIALEGALKLKEISYIHAEGYAAGEMKHGPIALIDEAMPVLVLTPHGTHYEKTFSNLEEVRARGGRVIAVASEGDEQIAQFTQDVLWVPELDESLMPILCTIPLQLLAYYMADLKGTDVDQPRNLAKSVTVE